MKDINWPRLIVQVLLACLVVGFLLNLLSVEPLDIFRNAWGTIVNVVEFAWNALDDIVNYVLVGAIIVIPVVVIGLLLSLRKPGGRPPKGE